MEEIPDYESKPETFQIKTKLSKDGLMGLLGNIT
jgi:hypothetical protein